MTWNLNELSWKSPQNEPLRPQSICTLKQKEKKKDKKNHPPQKKNKKPPTFG